MDAASGVERDRIVATLCTVASHLLAWLPWLRFAALPAPEAAADPPLRLVWIDPPAVDATPALSRPVSAIGEFFGGPGDSAGPCPRIRHNITRQSTGDDSERLQEALRREREACRP